MCCVLLWIPSCTTIPKEKKTETRTHAFPYHHRNHYAILSHFDRIYEAAAAVAADCMISWTRDGKSEGFTLGCSPTHAFTFPASLLWDTSPQLSFVCVVDAHFVRFVPSALGCETISSTTIILSSAISLVFLLCASCNWTFTNSTKTNSLSLSFLLYFLILFSEKNTADRRVIVLVCMHLFGISSKRVVSNIFPVSRPSICMHFYLSEIQI